MAFSITYSRGANTYNLNGFDSTTGLTFYYLGDSGHGLTPFHLITQRGAFQQGETTVDYRKDPRVIVVPLLILTNTLTSQAAARELLIKMFHPSNVQGTLTIANDTIVRSITVRSIGGLAFENREGEGYYIKTAVQLRADDPTWYDPTLNSISATPSIAGTTMPIPLLIPLTLGAGSINATITINYSGSANSYPIITATGPITSLVITNTSTGQVISFGSTTIAAGRTYSINLQYGYKTVIDDLGLNHYDQITAASNLATWSINCDPEVTGGTNSITISGTGATSTSNVTIQYYTRYDGI